MLVADDHPVFRLGLTMALTSLGFGTVVEAIDGHHAVELARNRHFDVVILDVRMPRKNGIDAARAIGDQCRTSGASAPVIVMLTTYEEPAVVQRAVAAGAAAFYSKETEPKALALAIDRLLVGDETIGLPNVELPDLSPRERDVLKLLVAGSSVKEMAGALSISVDTVKDHVARVYAKLDVNDRVGAVNAARRFGWTVLGEIGSETS